MGRDEGSGWGTHVYLWQIHFNIGRNQYNIVKFKNKIKKKKEKKVCGHLYSRSLGTFCITFSGVEGEHLALGSKCTSFSCYGTVSLVPDLNIKELMKTKKMMTRLSVVVIK